ncbi:MAG: YqgE/AlgH family protein [Acidobacteriota bacterium]
MAAGESLAGKFLVAEPQVNDPRFARGVVFLIQHDAQGAMGLLVNRELGPVDAGELLRSLDLETPGEGKLTLYYGGPVEPQRGFILHSTDVTRPTSREVIPGVAFSADAALLEEIAAGKGPRKYRILLGYAGWAPGQLEREIGRGDWSILEAAPAEIFSDDAAHTWERLMGDRIMRM